MPRHLFQVTVNLPGNLRNNNNEVFNPYIFVRSRLYHFVFHRFALVYSKIFSPFHRKLIEFFILLTALFFFILLVYIHVEFVQTRLKCLQEYKEPFKNADILRVEILSGKGKENYTLMDSYFKEKAIRLQIVEGQARYIYSDNPQKEANELFSFKKVVAFNESIKAKDALKAFNNISIGDMQESKHLEPELEVTVEEKSVHSVSESRVLPSYMNKAYIMEFSLEYGYLRLSPAKRQELNISVIFAILDPEENACFGGPFNKFLLDYFLGYDNVLLSSIKSMADKKNVKGFVRNAVIDVEYIFLNNWINEKSYFTAGFVMMVFTLTISTLLRHSHHQIFIVVGYWVHHIITSLERRSNIFDAIWPRNFMPSSGAPVLTVILALVGMEAVMSDFFHDRAIALYIIVVVWFADVYDAVCCQSPMSKRHWYRFFYLYHFLFYAYNYKFSGVYWPLTFITSWLFIYHSMVFFFHHYELPRFLHRAAMYNATRNANNRRASQNHQPGNDPPLPLPDHQDSANGTSQPSDHLQALEDNQPNDSEVNQPDQQQPAENVVNEGVVAAEGYGPVFQNAADTENSGSLQIMPAIVSTAEGNSLESNDKDECHQEDDNEVKNGHDGKEISDERNYEEFVVEGIFKGKEMSFDKIEKGNVDEKAEKQKNDVHSDDENDLHSRESSVD